eukprot:s1851_g8.t1
MPAKLGGHMGPRPLRDEKHLMGMPDLQGADRIKVDLANQLYEAAISIIHLCFLLQCLLSIENPARSWLWQILAKLVQQSDDPQFVLWYSQLESVYFDACAHGSSRDKRTKLLASDGLFSGLAQDCPQDHVHLSWQPYKAEHGIVFPTAQEAEYPALLCTRMADCVLQKAHSMKVVPQMSQRLKDLLKLGLGQQSIRHPPLVPEFAEYKYMDMPVTNPAFKLLAAPLQQGQQNTEQLEVKETNKRARTTFKYGVWHTPEQFLEKAQQVSHPMDDESFLHPATREAIKKVVHTDPTVLAKERLATVYRLRKFSDELSGAEAALKSSLHQDVRKCVAAKNISLFEHLLKQLDFWDMDVVRLMKEGIPLVGLQEPPKGYTEMLVPASITEEELEQSALWRRKALMGMDKCFSVEEEDALQKATAEEVSLGFLEGPYREDEISVLLDTETWSLNPRFALFQGPSGKVRIIDDAKKSSVNASYSSTVKLQLQDVDYAASMVVALMQELSSASLPHDQWMGKTFDLSKAYKQLAIHPSHQKHAIVGFPVAGEWKFYKSLSLPFGCTGSVYGFVRISQALWYIITRLLHAVTSHYFDDFPTVERSAGCKVLSLAVSAVLDMLGWAHAKEGDKALNFAAAFDLLGVNFNLATLPSGVLTVANKQSRIAKLCQMLEDISRDGEISQAKASELQGLLTFAVGYYSGKSLKHLVSAFMPFADRPGTNKSGELTALCEYAKLMLTSLAPRKHSVLGSKIPVLIFTDGAWENDIASAGAVIIDGSDRLGCEIKVPKSLVDHWLENAGDQISSQIELWALVAVKWFFRERFKERRVISWIDNEAARICAIKANSPSGTMRSLSRLLADIEALWPGFHWIERVCSYSNPGDLPSRGKLAEAVRRYGIQSIGTLDVSDDLEEITLKLFTTPFDAALLKLGQTPEHTKARNTSD